MVKLLRILLMLLFCIAACEEDPKPTVTPGEETENPADTTADPPADTISTDTVSNDSVPDDNENDPAPGDTVANMEYYFPPNADDTWESISAESLGWNMDSLNLLLQFVSGKDTYGFIILHKGRIVTEKYWNDWNAGTKYMIASAGKTITAFLVGLAQQEEALNIENKTSDYLGVGWTNTSSEKEAFIKLHHQLSMTSGLNEAHDGCNEPACLEYVSDAGTRWAYHNASYNFLHNVITAATGLSIDDYTKTRLADKIGLRNWTWENNILALSTRDMARFGLLILQKGNWGNEEIMKDRNYFNAMISSSGNQNKSYGYLWWLNGKDSFMVPGDETVHKGSLVATAPADMFAAMGKGDKKIYVVPSLDLVIVRHGDDTGEHTFGPSSFDSELWKRLQGVIGFHSN